MRGRGVVESFLQATENHAPCDLHVLGFAFISDDLVHFDTTALVGRRDAQISDPLVTAQERCRPRSPNASRSARAATKS